MNLLDLNYRIMKKHFTKYLTEDLGFKAFRFIDGKFVENKINDFSTMQAGGVDLRYKKGDIVITWGLHEYGKPPTLISPRPRIQVMVDNKSTDSVFHGSDYMFEQMDDAMNICLKNESNEDVFKAMFDDSMQFKYDLTK